MADPASDSVSIIVPTYKEADNLRLLAGRIFSALSSAGLRGELIVVDDDSRDGTDTIVAELARTHDVRLIVRENERGLSSAVICGMKAARHDFFVVLDADLSHPPERIPEVLEPLRSRRADFVFGSRYVAGGTTRDWGVFRKLNSRVATWLARPLTNVCDPMAGFFAIHRRTFEAADRLNPIGYKIGLEILVKGRCLRVVEVPIEFSDRLHGRSKLTPRQQFLYLVHLWRLYAYRWPIATRAAPLLVILAALAAWWILRR
ncbi:MAG: polyprenol monophosphomannose synthase [Phycisphaerae bacterium]|nr:polyprenol monophosphomannose synthase [Phycisphaerae bacterium]